MRQTYAAAAILCSTMGITPASSSLATETALDELSFRVLLDDKQIGQHTFKISGAGNSTVVSIEAEFDVRVLFITAYSYLHENTEIWQDGCLHQIDSATNANGKRFAVNGRKVEGSFELATLDRSSSLSSKCVMTFAYWDRDFLSQSRLLNAQTGEYIEVQTEQLGKRRLKLAGDDIWAEGFRISTKDGELDIKVWYRENADQWIGLESKVNKGKILRYELKEIGGLSPAERWAS